MKGNVPVSIANVLTPLSKKKTNIRVPYNANEYLPKNPTKL